MFWYGFFKSMGNIIVNMFSPVFFGRAFPDFKSQYAYLNAIALTSLGLTSTLLGGIICDRSEKEKKYRKHS